jgi:pimeloyl-ACP methyl ester carboxylesterase
MREVCLNGGGLPMSALLAEPPAGVPPRCVVVALHGAGMRAGYFHGRAHPSVSLLDLASGLGATVLALDRPGYGRSAQREPAGRDLAGQTEAVLLALADFAARYPTGAGMFLLAHSYGGKLALSLAACRAFGNQTVPLLGVDISGLSHRYAVDEDRLARFGDRDSWALHWGPLGLYPPGTFRLAAPLLAEVPRREQHQVPRWPELFPRLAAAVRVPVRLTFAEHEGWWRHDDETVAAMVGMLGSSRVVVDRLSGAGHNISLGWAARVYHLRALAFLDECLPHKSIQCP